MVFGPKFQFFQVQLNKMRDEAKTWWLVSGLDIASSYFFKRKSVSHLNHEVNPHLGTAFSDNNS